MSTNGSFAISVTDGGGRTTTSYSPGQAYSVQLHSTGTTTFRGYILSGFATSGTPNYGSTARAGTIRPVTSGMITQASCSGGVTQSDGSVDKTTVSGTWSSPTKSGTGTIQLFAIVITTKNGNNYRISSPLLVESTIGNVSSMYTTSLTTSPTTSPITGPTTSPTASPTTGPTASPTTSPTPTSTIRRTQTSTPSITQSQTIVPIGISQSGTPSITPSPSTSDTPSITPSPSTSDTPSTSPTCSVTPFGTPIPSPSETPTISSSRNTSHSVIHATPPLTQASVPPSPATWQIVSYVLISAVVSFAGVGIAMYVVHRNTTFKLFSKRNPVVRVRNPIQLRTYPDVTLNNTIPIGNSQEFLTKHQHSKKSFAPVTAWAARIDNLADFE